MSTGVKKLISQLNGGILGQGLFVEVSAEVLW